MAQPTCCTAPYRDEASLCVLPAPQRAQTPRPCLGESSSHYGDTTLEVCRRGPFHSMEARRREEREIERHLRRPCLSVRLREFVRAQVREKSRLEGEEEKRSRRNVKDL